MKRIYFIIMLSVLIFQNKLYSSEKSNNLFEKYSSADFIFDKSTVGGKILLPIFNFHFYKHKDSTLFGIDSFTPPTVNNISWHTKVGNLSCGGLYSKLKNPLFSSSITPFSSIFSKPVCITGSLPSSNSSEKPLSTFLDFQYLNKKTTLKNLQIAYFAIPAEDISVLSGKIELKILKNSTISISSCAGYFDYSENKLNSWFTKEPFFPSGTHFCNLNQLSFVNSLISANLFIGFYETPFANFENIFRGEVKSKIKHLVLCAGGVYIPKTILTCNDESFSKLYQLKSGIQYNFLAGKKNPFFVRIGLNTYFKKNIVDNDQNLKLSTGVQLSFDNSTLSLISSTSFSTDSSEKMKSKLEFDNTSFSIQNTWYNNKFSPTVQATFGYNPSKDSSVTTNESINLNLIFISNPRISLKNKISFTQKDKKLIKKAFSSNISIKGYIKKISVTCNIGLSLE